MELSLLLLLLLLLSSSLPLLLPIASISLITVVDAPSNATSIAVFVGTVFWLSAFTCASLTLFFVVSTGTSTTCVKVLEEVIRMRFDDDDEDDGGGGNGVTPKLDKLPVLLVRATIKRGGDGNGLIVVLAFVVPIAVLVVSGGGGDGSSAVIDVALVSTLDKTVVFCRFW